MSPHNANSRSRVTKGVTEGGQFATEARTESDVTLSPTTSQDRLLRLDPVDFDGELAELYDQRFDAMLVLQRRRDHVHRLAGDRRAPRSGVWGYTLQDALETVREQEASGTFQAREARRALDDLEAAEVASSELDKRMNQYEESFTARGGWTRAFLVSGMGGHVHSSMDCSTCNKGKEPTRFAWMTDHSGASEQQIVAAAGWRACTLCYPSAPVGDERSLPTSMFSREERDAAQERQRREAAAAQRQAERISKGLTADGSPLEVAWTARNAPGWDYDPATRSRTHNYTDRPKSESFKTERAATMWLVEKLADQELWPNDTRFEDEEPAREAVLEAIATKHGKTMDQVREEIAKKVSSKVARER